MLAKVYSVAVSGLDAYSVEVEVDLAAGLPMFTVVGLPDLTVRESRERVRSALRNSGFSFPQRKRSKEHTSELQSRLHLVCRLLLEKKKKNKKKEYKC